MQCSCMAPPGAHFVLWGQPIWQLRYAVSYDFEHLWMAGAGATDSPPGRAQGLSCCGRLHVDHQNFVTHASACMITSTQVSN